MLTGSRTVHAAKIVFVVLLAQASSHPANAAEDPREVARGHYARGLELAGQGAYEAALAEFKEAYGVSPHFAVLYNIGQADVALGRPLEAIESLSRYLRDGQEQVPRPRRQQVEAQIALLESLFDELTITTDRPGALISVDGHEVGRTPLYQPVRLAAGTHKISAVFDGGPTVTRTLTLGQGEHQVLTLEIPAAAAIADDVGGAKPAFPAPGRLGLGAEPRPGSTTSPLLAREQRSESNDTRRRRSTMSTVGYAAVGVGAALGGTALGVYLLNRGRYHDWQIRDAALQRDKTGADYHDRQSANNQLADSLATANHLIAGFSVAGGALLAAGLTLLVVDGVRGSGKEGSVPSPQVADIEIGWGWQGSRSAAVSWNGVW